MEPSVPTRYKTLAKIEHTAAEEEATAPRLACLKKRFVINARSEDIWHEHMHVGPDRQTYVGRQRQQRNSKSIRNVEVDDEDDQVQNDEGSEYEAGFKGSMFRVGGISQTPIVAVTVNGNEMNMELDTAPLCP